MERNHEITAPGMLLDENGELREPGWSRTPLLKYDRSMIKAPAWRIKEWDYYIVTGKDFAAAFTISDDGYIGLQSVSMLLFGDKPFEHTQTVLNAFPMGKTGLPQDPSAGRTRYIDKKLKMQFDAGNGERRIRCRFDDFLDGKPFLCDITLKDPGQESMTIATPWDAPHAFYYNRKINCMRASGHIKFGGKVYKLSPDTDFGTLDWGRGVWTYDNTWYWSSGNADIGGNAFGFNFGYGFGNTSAATENVIFWNGRAHKLDDVSFITDANDHMRPWRITSSDGRVEMRFSPVYDRAAKIDLKAVVSDQHQVFGRMSGTAVLDDGTEVNIKDVLCFAEKVHNRY